MKNDFDQALDDCAGRIASGESNLDECLRWYPEYAAQLKPLLQTAIQVERGRGLKPSADFKARGRSQLMAHIRAHPRQRSWGTAFSTPSLAWRLGTALAVLILVFFITGTVFAQNALPGQALYGWKLSSEQVWRGVSPDPVGVDLALADRRANEIAAESSDAVRQAEAVNGYQEVLSRLTSETTRENSGRIVNALKVHQKEFSAAGVAVPELESLLSSPPGLPPSMPTTQSSPDKKGTNKTFETPGPPKSTPASEDNLVPTHLVPTHQPPGSKNIPPKPALPPQAQGGDHLPVPDNVP